MFRKWFGGGEGDEEEAPRTDYTLDAMQVGFLVDYDLKTWEVVGYSTCEYEGDETQEWELRSGDQIRYLEKDGEQWALTAQIPLREIREEVARAIAGQGDPPEELHYQERGYRAVASSAGEYREGGRGLGREFVVWSYESAGGERVLFVSQWSEREFRAYEGQYVEEYQFTDILPAPREGGP
jgi:hypothetical protein